MDGYSKDPREMRFISRVKETKVEKLIMKLTQLLCYLLPSLLLCLVLGPIQAQADGKSLIDRQNRLCNELGYGYGSIGSPCEIKYEKGRHRVEITLTVDEDVDEPNNEPDIRLPGGSVQVYFQDERATFSDLFVPIERSSPYWVYYNMFLVTQLSAPCLSPECTEGKAADPEGYHGVSEQDLTNLELIEGKLPLQVASQEMTQEIQRMLNTTGYPVITEVKSVKLLASNVGNPGATILKAVVFVRVATYGSDSPVTINNPLEVTPALHLEEVPITVDPNLDR